MAQRLSRRVIVLHALASRLRLACAALAVAATLAVGPASAHGDLHTQIANLDARIAAQPHDAALLLRRAELHRIHREFALADADYARVAALAPEHDDVAWMRARNRVESGDATGALTALDAYLARRPDHASARLTRARAYVASHRAADALRDYEVALDRLPRPEPDHYLELVAAQGDAGLPPTAQIATLERGLARLGGVPALEDAALDVEIGAARWDDALRRIDRRVTASARPEQLLYRRALVLLQAARKSEAAVALHASEQAIGRLPASLRTPRAVAQLEEQVRRELQALAGDIAPAADR